MDEHSDTPQITTTLEDLWSDMLADKNHHIIIGILNDKVVSSCVLVVIPNLTRNQRPYALVENVITHDAYRKRGYATGILNYAKKIAVRKNFYKIMLMTDSKNENTIRFYEKQNTIEMINGFYSAFIQWNGI